MSSNFEYIGGHQRSLLWCAEYLEFHDNFLEVAQKTIIPDD